MLKSIKISKLFGRFDYELAFSNEGIMIITGPNGYGKSTILKIVNSFCSNSLEAVLSYTFKKLTIVCDNISIQILKNKNSFKINDFEFPYPNGKWDKRRGMPPYIRRMGYDEYFDMRTGEKIQLLGGVPNQAKLGDDEEVEQIFVFAILDAFEGEIGSKGFKDKIEKLNKAFALIKCVQTEIGKVHFIQEQRLIEKREIPEDERRYNQPKAEYITVINENSEKLKAELAEIMKRHSALSSNLDSTYIKRLFEVDQSKVVSVDVFDRLRELQKKQDKLQKY